MIESDPIYNTIYTYKQHETIKNANIAGYSDCVRCFFCGGGLNSWSSEDNPWVEHAKWLPDCAFVKLCKGQAFVNMCTASRSSGLVGNDEIGVIIL